MTIVAGIAAGDMGRVFADRSNAVVAGAAVSDDLRMIDADRRYPDGRAVAVFTYIGRLNVCLVLASRFDAVVATDAVAGNVHVVKICRYPAECCVTVVAGITAGDMRRVLARCADAIVTAHAIANDTRVIKYGRQPGCGRMTIIALVTGRNVSRRFAGGFYTVVTAHAAAADGGMIHK